jgi:hypothetical protein
MFIFLGVAAFFRWLTPGYSLLPVKPVQGDIGGGGGCLRGPYFKMALYDRNGSRQDFDQSNSTYVGDAPLYQPDRTYPALEGQIPCSYPASLPADVVQTWPEVYPLSIEAQPPEILSGESKNLEVKMWVDTKFSGMGYDEVFPVVIQPGEQVSVSFSFSAPNFVFSPPNDPTETQSLQIGNTVRQRWSIAPTESAIGEQSINVKVNGLKNAYTAEAPFALIKVNVQPRDRVPLALRSFLIGLGISPGRLAFFSSLVAILVAVLVAAKWLLDLYKTWQDLRQARDASEAKPAPKAKPKSGKSKPRR